MWVHLIAILEHSLFIVEVYENVNCLVTLSQHVTLVIKKIVFDRWDLYLFTKDDKGTMFHKRSKCIISYIVLSVGIMYFVIDTLIYLRKSIDLI